MSKSMNRFLTNDVVLLAPRGCCASRNFNSFKPNSIDYSGLLEQAQMLRGSVYSRDGAIQPSQLQIDGRYIMEDDREYWHLLLLNQQSAVCGCARFRLHSTSVRFDQLALRHCPLVSDNGVDSDFRIKVEEQISAAQIAGLSYLEFGGWALGEEARNTSAVLKCILGIYAWSQLIGGCLGICSATVRHGSASILRRVGGIPFSIGPRKHCTYYDSTYQCEMQVLGFDSRYPATRYASLVEVMRQELISVPVFEREYPASNKAHFEVDPSWTLPQVFSGSPVPN